MKSKVSIFIIIIVLPDYCDLLLLDKSWSSLGLFSSLFVHKTDQSFYCNLLQNEDDFWGNDSLQKKLPPLPLPADAWYNQSQHTQLISSPTSQSKTKYLKNVENFMKVFFYWRGKTNLGIKDFSCFNRIGERTKYKSGGNLSIIDTLHLNFDIFTRGHWRDIDIIRPDLLHFDFSLQQRKICLNLLGVTNLAEMKW